MGIEGEGLLPREEKKIDGSEDPRAQYIREDDEKRVAWVAAHAEKPFRDAARTPGLDKDVLDQMAEEKGEQATTAEREKITLEALRYLSKQARNLELISRDAQVMIAEAHDRGITVDLSKNKFLDKFKAGGEYEVALIHIRAEAEKICTDLFNQGVKMTSEDLKARLEKMDKLESN